MQGGSFSGNFSIFSALPILTLPVTFMSLSNIWSTCLFGLTVGQCNAIENIQKRALRMIYCDTDSDYEIPLIVTRMDSLKDRHEMLMARFFKKQVLASNALLHYLLPEPRDNDTIHSLRNSQPFPSIRARTTKFHKSFLPYCLKNFTGVLWLCTVFYCFNVSMF